jgi:hypothetical protein
VLDLTIQFWWGFLPAMVNRSAIGGVSQAQS